MKLVIGFPLIWINGDILSAKMRVQSTRVVMQRYIPRYLPIQLLFFDVL